jgi:hypothetical protein
MSVLPLAWGRSILRILVGLVVSHKPYMSDSLEQEQNKIMGEDVLSFYETAGKNIYRP